MNYISHVYSYYSSIPHCFHEISHYIYMFKFLKWFIYYEPNIQETCNQDNNVYIANFVYDAT
jgi:hypothetical protein